MSCATVRDDDLPHTVFLRRFAAPTGTSSAARLSQGAFLTLRLVDLLRPDSRRVHPDAFEYQRRATERLCHQLPADDTETAHLIGLVHSTADAFREHDVRLVVPALLAYGHYLEDQLHLEEALDVLESTLEVGAEQLGASDAVAVHLRMGRVNRKLNRFDDGDRQYALAGALAESARDIHSALLSRVGRAISTQARGNLAASERLFWELTVDARAAGQRVIEAHAHHGLGATLFFRGQVAEAIAHTWRAFELYEDESPQIRALGDLGTMLLTLGEAVGAERALLEVVRRAQGTQDVVTNAMIELMNCASYRRDQVGFERWRGECESRSGTMPPNIFADFYLKAGIGQARFGRLRRADALMDSSLKVATSAGLNELIFRIERIRNGLRGCESQACDAAAEPIECGDSGVREVAASLAHLVQ